MLLSNHFLWTEDGLKPPGKWLSWPEVLEIQISRYQDASTRWTSGLHTWLSDGSSSSSSWWSGCVMQDINQSSLQFESAVIRTEELWVQISRRDYCLRWFHVCCSTTGCERRVCGSRAGGRCRKWWRGRRMLEWAAALDQQHSSMHVHTRDETSVGKERKQCSYAKTSPTFSENIKW